MYNRALKLIRQYHRLSQVEVANKLALSKSFISELESGKKKASIEILERYSSAFKIPVSSIMLFAECAENPDALEKTRVYTADKALKMLEWLNNTSIEANSDLSH